MRMHHIVICGLSGHKHQDFLKIKKVIEHKMCLEGQDYRLDDSEVPSATTARTPVPDMCCMVYDSTSWQMSLSFPMFALIFVSLGVNTPWMTPFTSKNADAVFFFSGNDKRWTFCYGRSWVLPLHSGLFCVRSEMVPSRLLARRYIFSGVRRISCSSVRHLGIYRAHYL